MSQYKRRGRYLVPVNGNTSRTPSGVRTVTGRDGTVVLRLGPTFAEPIEAVKKDPTAGLMAELEERKRARKGT